MNLSQQVFAQAALLAGELQEGQQEMLKALSAAATASLGARLRQGLRPEDCKADFVAAASLFALAALNQVKDGTSLDQITAGDLTVRRSGNADAASRVLQRQAELMIGPYLKDSFCFRGV